jgi:hypothetical protein
LADDGTPMGLDKLSSARVQAAGQTLDVGLDPAFVVMAGLVPAIHVFATRKAWMPATSAGMTMKHDHRESA